MAKESCAVRSGRCHAERTLHSVCESAPKGSFSCQEFTLRLCNCYKVHAHAKGPKLLERHLGQTPGLPKPVCPPGVPMIGEFIRDCVRGDRKLAQSYQLTSPLANGKEAGTPMTREEGILKSSQELLLKLTRHLHFKLHQLSCNFHLFFVCGKSQSESKHDPGHSRTENN